MIDLSRSSRITSFWQESHNPGPGAYKIDTNHPNRFSFRRSTTHTLTETKPGPGSYSPSAESKTNIAKSVFLSKKSRVAMNDMVFTSINYRNHSSEIPGPGSYFSPKSEKDSSPTVLKFVTIKKKPVENSLLNLSNEKIYLRRKPSRRIKNEVWSRLKGVGFSTESGDRQLWEPRNFRHPYRMPPIENPGPGYYLIRGTFDQNFYRNSIG